MWLPRRIKKALEASLLGQTDEEEAPRPESDPGPAAEQPQAESPQAAPTESPTGVESVPPALDLHEPSAPPQSSQLSVEESLTPPEPPFEEASETPSVPPAVSPEEELIEARSLQPLSAEAQEVIRKETGKYRELFKSRATHILYLDLASPKTPVKFASREEESVYLQAASRRALDQARYELAPIELKMNDRAASRLLDEILAGVIGFGVIQPLLEDPGVSEVMINGPGRVYVERAGKVSLSPVSFSGEPQLMQVIHKIVSPLGRRVDRTVPTCDARLPDGSRVNIVIPPLALNGPTVTIRKFSRKALGVVDLLARGTLSEGMAAFLDACIKLRLNIVVSGGTGSGKTTTLNVLSSCIPEDERIVTLEDAAELSLQQEHVVSLESRPPNVEGAGEVTLRSLLRNALRMRPDRIVVGECRGAEALDMLQAMNTGHEGSMTTGHANTPRDMIARLETMVMMGGMPLTSKTIREQIARSVDLIVQQARLHDGSRRIVSITEITGLEGGQVTLSEIFRFAREGVADDGKVLGHFEYAGNAPTFLHRFHEEGVALPPDVFGAGVSLPKLMKRVLKQRAREAKRERDEIQRAALDSSEADVPYERSTLMMSIRGMRVLDWEQAMARPRIEEEGGLEEHFAAPALGQRQALTDKEILGPMRRWLLAELAARLERLVAFEKLDIKAKDLAEERRVLGEKLRYCFQDVAREYRIQASEGARETVIAAALLDAAGLGPIQPLLDDLETSEVMVNGPDQIYCERGGKMILTDARFRDGAHVRQIIDRILTRVGRRADDSNPIADARLQDGSRVNIVLPPISLVGPSITIRKFRAAPIQVGDLVGFGSLSEEMALFLRAAVASKVSLVVAGGTGSGKTSTLNALSGFIPEGERLLTIEDAAELRLQQPHVVPLESRPASREGTAAVTIRDLVKNALRMRPDRIIIGECRGPEALDMLQAMNTGHEGSMTTLHANSPRDLVGRIETLVLMGNLPLTSRAIRDQIFSAIQLIVQQERLPDGKRRITSLAEFSGIVDGVIQTEELFHFDRQAAREGNGSDRPLFSPTGRYPRFLEELALSGLELPDDLFGPGTSMSAEIARREADRLTRQRMDVEQSLKSAPNGPATPVSGGKGAGFGWKKAIVKAPPRPPTARLGRQKARERLEENRHKTREFLKLTVSRRAMTALATHEKHTAEGIRATVSDCLERVLDERRDLEVPRKQLPALLAEISAEVGGLGPIQALLDDPEISEVMVNGPFQVYVERKGRLMLSDVNFRDEDHALHVLNRILSPLARRCDIKVPLADGRLADGSRVHAAIPPIALNGPTLTIRKFSEVPFDLDRLIEAGAAPRGVGDFLRRCVQMRLNMVISGGTGSGKTTLLNALSGEIPEGERVLTIEDSAELSLQVTHVVGLEARMPNIEGRGAVTVRDLVKNALRMRPDRIVVGECRGAEALDMLQAMNTGHEGSMTTAHANTTQEMIARLETMVMMAGSGATIQGIREQVASAIDLIVQLRRFPDGRRRITQISEVIGMEGDKLRLEDLFLWNARGVDENGHHLGELLPTGREPSFMDRMRTEGFAPDSKLFHETEDPTVDRMRNMRSILESTGIKWPL